MGSGASTSDDLTAAEKVEITKALEEQYAKLKSDNNSQEDGKMLEILKETFSAENSRLMQNRETATATEEETESNKFNLLGSVKYEAFGSNCDSLGSLPKLLAADHDEPGKLLKSKTSSQLLSEMNENVESDQEKIANFISQLKAGDVPTKQGSNFRARRLTYTSKTGDEVVEGAPAAAVPAVVPAATTKSPAARRVRTTIFASSEIGVVQEKKAPFPDDVLGTYSCHGIEPSYDEEDGIHQKINQDRGCVVYPYNSQKNEALFMVLDGHGEQGDKVSEFVMRQIVVSLEKDPELNTNPVQALKSAFVQTNTALLVTKIQYMTSGCTAVAVYAKDKTLYVANVGDSRCVMAYKDGDAYKAKDYSRDHKPDDPEEMARIVQWGGFVSPPPEPGLSARVYLDPAFTMIGLAMARSIGDHAVKAVGVIPEPEVKVFEIEEQDQFMIMASDGVWEFISSQEAVDIVSAALDKGMHEACQELIETAASRWQEEEGDYRDDITAVVMKVPLPYQIS